MLQMLTKEKDWMKKNKASKQTKLNKIKQNQII